MLEFFKRIIKPVDTITTKLLLLILFVTLIPLAVVYSFNSSLNYTLFQDRIDNDINSANAIFKDSFQNELILFKNDISSIADNNEFNYKKYKKLFNLDYIGVLSLNKINKIHNIHFKKFFKTAFIENKILVEYDVIDLKELSIPYRKIGLARIAAMPYNNGNDLIIAVQYIKPIDSYFRTISLVPKIDLTIYEFFNNKPNFKFTGYKNLFIKNNYKYIVSNLKNKKEITNIKTDNDGNLSKSLYGSINNYFNKKIAFYALNYTGDYSKLGQINIIISQVAIVSLIIAILIAIIFSRAITTPLLNLVKISKQIAKGDFEIKNTFKGNDEIAKLSIAFKNMTDNLFKQEQLRNNFIATLTHDLKVPMLAQNQTINYFLKQVYGPISDEQEDVLNLIKSTNLSSLEMVSTLLEVYRYDYGQAKLFKINFDIVKLAKESIDEVRSLADAKKMSIVLKTSSHEINVNADEREIKRVFHNLISNAINNGIQRGCIYIDIDKMTKDIFYHPNKTTDIYTTLTESIDISNSILISVEDDGAGIAREDMLKLFKRFSLSKGRKPTGTGLGLYYAHQVIQEHNGHIWSESKEQKGTKFAFYLPLKEGE